MTREEREAAVDWFAMRIKLKMREPRNEAKGGWRNCGFTLLSRRMVEEQRELFEELDGDQSLDAIISECCDVAFYAMAVADRARQMKG